MESRLLLHGRNATTATPIELDTTIVGTSETNDEHDWFVFSAKAGVSYRIDSDAQVGIPDTERPGGFNFRRAFDVAEDEDVYLVVTPRSEPFEYQLRVTSFDDEHGNSAETATEIQLNSPMSTGVAAYDVDYFAFQAKGQTDYVVQLNAVDTQGLARFFIENTEGRRVGQDAVRGRDTVGRFRVSEDQPIYLAAYAIQNRAGEFSILVSEASDTDRAGNDLSSAKELEMGVAADELIDFDYGRRLVQVFWRGGDSVPY